MADLAIHMGLQKTATSYVQARMAHNRAALARHGVIYPRMRGDWDHAFLLTPWRRTAFPRWLYAPHGPMGHVERVLARLRDAPGTVHLNCELFFLLARDPDALADFCRRIEGFGTLRVTLALRTQIELLQAIYLQAVRVRRAPLDPQRFLARSIERRETLERTLDFGDLHARLTDAFGAGNVTVVDYETLRTHPEGPFGWFLDRLGIGAPATDFADVPDAAANRSPDPLAGAVMRILWPRERLLADPVTLHRLTRLLRGTPPRPTTMFTRALETRAREVFDPMNRALVKAVRRTQPDFAFAIPPMHEGTLYPEDLGAEDWAAIARLAAGRRAPSAARLWLGDLQAGLPPAWRRPRPARG
ncbi:hypothetical protein E2L08_02390 [Palleronia sediminis]|uniref:Uncharacterized protein n=1 Tax=Palleronia sediminis TaxID=2547833 RepID=A0A4R6AK16_9RHOB|nr:hypothetical protein [Palleronia sediminis]TDL83514.1 hypothetical protein E2L08_02390 [Palleronia sediminis]